MVWTMTPPAESWAQGPWAVYVMNAHGAEVQRVRYDRQSLFGSPTWLHDGKQIAYDSGQRGFDDAHMRLHILDLDGEEKPVAIPNQFGQRNSDGVWSPDGTRAVFISDRG
jgi:Tol biopolymer transport system component